MSLIYRLSRAGQIAALACLLLLATSSNGIAAPEEPLRLTGETMGTYYSIIVDSPGEASANDVQQKVEATLAEFSRQMSTWDPESEISQFNASTTTEWFPVSRDFAHVVEESLRIHQLSNGAFDPTLAPLIELWGFGSKKQKRIPTDEEIAAARNNVGMSGIQVRLDPPAIRKNKPQLSINLSAIAPGFGIDAVAQMLEEQGFTSYLVDIGGEDRAGLPKASGSPWKIGVESPLGGLHKLVELSQGSVATSGDYRNFFEVNGKKFSHVFDPTTGSPVPNPPASVSVLHRSCMTADAWGTTLMVLGSERGMALAEQQGLDVMFLMVDESGQLVERSRGVFAKLPVLAAESGAAKVEGPSPRDPNEKLVAEPDPRSEDPVLGVTAESAEAAAETSEEPGGLSRWLFPVAVALGIFLLSVAGMAIGAIFRRKTLKGSCGGLAALAGHSGASPCEVCTKPKENCVNPEQRDSAISASSGEHNS